jgi:hypothetical protein
LRPHSPASVIWRKSESSALTNLQQVFRLLQCLASHPQNGFKAHVQLSGHQLVSLHFNQVELFWSFIDCLILTC